MVNGAIYLIASNDFFVNRPTWSVMIQQVQRVASTYHRTYCSARPLTTLAHTKSNTCTTFILFYSCLTD